MIGPRNGYDATIALVIAICVVAVVGFICEHRYSMSKIDSHERVMKQELQDKRELRELEISRRCGRDLG